MYSAESQPTFRRNISPASSGLKSKPSKKPCLLLVRPGSLIEAVGTDDKISKLPSVSMQSRASADHVLCLFPASCSFFTSFNLQP
jgi:hypothetical protein